MVGTTDAGARRDPRERASCRAGSTGSTASAASRRCSSSSTTAGCSPSPATRATPAHGGSDGSSTGTSPSSCSSCCLASRWRSRPPGRAGSFGASASSHADARGGSCRRTGPRSRSAWPSPGGSSPQPSHARADGEVRGRPRLPGPGHLRLAEPQRRLLVDRDRGAALHPLPAAPARPATVGCGGPARFDDGDRGGDRRRQRRTTRIVDMLMRLTPQFAALFTAGIVAAGILVASDRDASASVALAGARRGRPGRAGRSARRGRCGRWATSSGSTSRSGPATALLLAAVAVGRPDAVRAPARDPAAAAARRMLVQPLPHPRADRGDGPSRAATPRRRAGMPTFLVTLAIAVPLAVAFAMWFASLFEIPFQRHRSWAAWRDVVSARWGRRVLGEGARSSRRR